jgi:monoamine oxidase
VRYDVVIVGAGISGLACAAELSRNGIQPVILEARDVIGGRIRTYRPPDGGPVLELGAQVIHGDRNPLRDLVRHGIAAAPSPPSQPLPRRIAAWTVLHGRVSPLGALASGGMPPWEAERRLTADGAGRADHRVSGRQEDGRQEDDHQGNGASGSGPDDDGDVPVASWLAAQRLTGDHMLAAAEWFRQNWAAEPADLSARGIACARRRDTTGDGEYAFEGGYRSLADLLAAALDIRLRTPARALTWAPGRVEVATGDGEQVTAAAAVITAPPPVAVGERLAIAALPPEKVAAAAALPSGDGLCAVATLSRPAPESAVVFDADGQGGFVRCTAGRPEVLIVAKARAAAAVRAAGLAGLVSRVFPRWPAPEVTGAQIADWGRDRWSAGVFSYPGVGAGWAGRAWAAPVQRTLFFAGEATTAGSLPPTVHGALGSGLRAAGQIVEAWGR